MEHENPYENVKERVEIQTRRAGESLKPECVVWRMEPARRNFSVRVIYTLLGFCILLSIVSIVTTVVLNTQTMANMASAAAGIQVELSQWKSNATLDSERTHSLIDTLQTEFSWLKRNFSSCPKQWTRFKQSCYQISSGTARWADAQRSCGSMNAHLFVTNNVAEQEYVKTKLQKTSWIGLNDLVQEGDWRWVDGTDFSSSEKFWNAGEPNNAAEEDCVEMLPDGRWNDFKCDALKNWICEKPVWF
ncbi:CD209 antigen-like protein E [Hypanus sabinus]|uniref:CD209 antigen-like protein E n=1 Tax=Hypanus sabinus TaxID=79690 RepID=UPI0028C48CFF|nr:CD209 antigen-like protein E [Hypanus sabinus]